MKMEDLIRFSLQKTKIERLVVLLGFMEDGGTSLYHNKTQSGLSSSSSCFFPRAASACRLEKYIFGNCRPPLSDIHNPEHCRFAARDAKGKERSYYHAYTQAQKRRHRFRPLDGCRGGRGGRESLRRPQEWDSAPVPDFMGVWCDRLLVGDSSCPKRTALLRPYVPPLFQPQAIQQVGLTHRELSPSDVLLVDTAPSLPVGVLRLGTLSQHRRRVPQWVGPSVDRRWGNPMPQSPTATRGDEEELYVEGNSDAMEAPNMGGGLEKGGLERKEVTVSAAPMPYGKQLQKEPELEEEEQRRREMEVALSTLGSQRCGCCLSMDDAFRHFCSASPPFPFPHLSHISPIIASGNGRTNLTPGAQGMVRTHTETTTTSAAHSGVGGGPSAGSTTPPLPCKKNPEPFVLAIGCGPSHIPPVAPFSAEEEDRMQKYILPLAAFAVALWTVNPGIASEYIVQQTPLPSISSKGEVLCPPPLPPKYRQWKTMQDSMLSTRDTALLRAHFSRTSLDRRLSMSHQTYLAETLLRRLGEYERDCSE